MKKINLLMVAALSLVIAPGALAANDGEQIDFDIYTQDGFVTVWVDMSSLITSKRVNQMEDGIDIAVEYRLSLLRPRKLWGAEKLAESKGVFQVGFRVITENFFVSNLSSDSSSSKHFLSLAQFHKFLADSMSLKLAEIDSLAGDKRYYIELTLTCVSLTAFNIADTDESPEDDKSAVKWLFKEFLNLTNFGRQDYKVESRLFSLRELSAGR
ncbi:MAG: DUF4390 domain-containing protein [Candidatus Zixiibacteriota bacterium]|nr:MAG: DUF4390 domain-containing protein [candidate division Zixibacteria bacterium]